MSQSGRILLLDLLEVIRKYSDAEHRIKQKAIIDILASEYNDENLYIKRKTIKRNIEKLVDHFESIDQESILYEKNIRTSLDKKNNCEVKSIEYTDFGYRHEFTQAELYLIIDSIIFSKFIPKNQRIHLIKKLEGLSSKYFTSRLAHINLMPGKELLNKELFWNIAILDEAITNQKQVSFYYKKYNVNNKLQLNLEPRKHETGKPREYIINPYRMVPSNNYYYLICNNNKYDNISHYRVDRISNIKILETNQKSLRKIKGQEGGLNLINYMAEHIYMFSGKTIIVSIKFKESVLSDIIDWFGTDSISIVQQTDGEITASVKTNNKAMRKWALQYALYARVLSPKKLVEDIEKDLKGAMNNYNLK